MKLTKFGWLAPLVGAMLVLGLSAATPLGESLELSTLDLRFRLRPAPDRPSPVTVVVLRGEATVSADRRARADLAELLKVLNVLPAEKRPRSVVVDLVLNQSEDTVEGQVPPLAARIATATTQLGNVVHGFQLAAHPGEFHDAMLDEAALERFALKPGLSTDLDVASGAILPHPDIRVSLLAHTAALGFVNLSTLERNQSVVRSIPLVRGLGTGPRIYPSLALAGSAVAMCGGARPGACLEPGSFGILVNGMDSTEVPVSGRPPEFWINYRHRFGVDTRVASTRLSPSTDGASPPDMVMFHHSKLGVPSFTTIDGVVEVPGHVLAGQVLLVVDGQEGSGIHLALGSQYPIYTVHAQVMANILERDFLKLMSPIANLIVALLLAALTTLWRLKPITLERYLPRPPGGAMAHLLALVFVPELLLTFTWTVLAWVLFVSYSVWLPLAAPWAAMVGSFTGWRITVNRRAHAEVARLGELEHKHQRLVSQLAELTSEATEAQARVTEIRVQPTPTPVPQDDWQEILHMTATEMEELENTLDRALEVLSENRAHMTSAPSGDPPGGEGGGSLKKLRSARGEIDRILGEMKQVEGEMGRHPPGMEVVRRWLATRQSAYQGLLRHVQAVVTDAGDTQLRLRAPAPIQFGVGVPDPELERKTGCLTQDTSFQLVLRQVVEKIAPRKLPVLIMGESGTGKERIARSIHKHSERKKRFIVLNCTAISTTLLEAELFGTRKGAYTGSIESKAGVFVEADGGTLFLDEVGDMPMEMQAKLLRVLEDGEVRPVGGDHDVTSRVDVRVISATHRDVEEMVKKGQFREDLFHRLAGHVVHLPPLRARVGDIEYLAKRFLSDLTTEGKSRLELAPAALRRLQEHPWPGNVRSLKTTLERLADLNDTGVISEADVEAALTGQPIASLGGFELLSQEERTLLVLQRQHGFRAANCGQDDRYPGNRQAAARHLKALFCRALRLTSWSSIKAAELITGNSQCEETEAVARRIGRFVAGLQARLDAAGGDSTARSKLEAALAREYRSQFEHVKRVLEAIEGGRLVVEVDKANSDGSDEE